jgi:hypothetical protein
VLAFEAYEHGLIPGTHATNAAASSHGVMPAFLSGAAQPGPGATPTDSFVVGAARKFNTGRILVNDQPYPRQTKTVCLQPIVGQGVDAAALVGRRIEVYVPLTQYNGKPEYQVNQPGQFSIR